MTKTQIRVIRLIIAIIAIGAEVCLGMIFLIVAAFAGCIDGYLISTILTMILLGLWFVVWALQIWTRKKLVKSFLVIVLVFFLPIIAYESYKAYHRSIPRLREGIVWEHYQPFSENNKIAKLDKEVNLRFEDSIPKIDAGFSIYPFYASLIENIFTDKEYREYCLMGLDPSDVWRNLNPRKADLIFLDLDSIDTELDATLIAQDAFVFIVNKKNPISDLSIEQIKDIYSGKITNWKDVGGKDEKIKAYQRRDREESQLLFEKLMGDTPLIDGIPKDLPPTIKSVNEAYTNYSTSIGYIFKFYTYNSDMEKYEEIKILTIDGVEPNDANVKNGTYPYVRNFYAISLKENENKQNINKMVDWILSAQGQSLVQKAGFIPVK